MDPETEVLKQLGDLQLGELVEVHKELKLTAIPDGKEDNKSFILKTILRYLSSEEMQNAEDEGVSTFLVLLDFIKKTKVAK